jgi:hypothetical protein
VRAPMGPNEGRGEGRDERERGEGEQFF